jgi:hypothetical protein
MTCCIPQRDPMATTSLVPQSSWSTVPAPCAGRISPKTSAYAPVLKRCSLQPATSSSFSSLMVATDTSSGTNPLKSRCTKSRAKWLLWRLATSRLKARGHGRRSVKPSVRLPHPSPFFALRNTLVLTSSWFTTSTIALVRYQSLPDTIVQLFRLRGSGVIASSHPSKSGALAKSPSEGSPNDWSRTRNRIRRAQLGWEKWGDQSGEQLFSDYVSQGIRPSLLRQWHPIAEVCTTL